MFRIQPHSPEPIFQQLVDQVKDAVTQGLLREGDKLPSVRELARQVTVNPNTVVKAYDLLERDGVIVRRQGAGCFLTGKTTNLDPAERQARLDAALAQAVSEGLHLDFDAAAIRAALEAALKRQSPG
ncbi:MAG: GntR family transcriptional regulator [Planctomycetota bacterium]